MQRVRVPVIRYLALGLIITGLLAGATATYASGTISAIKLSVEAVSNGKTGVVDFTLPWVSGVFVHNESAPTAIYSSDNTLLGTLNQWTTTITPDPAISLGWAVTAAPNAATTFTISSAVITTSIAAATAKASAQVNLTESGALNGASLTAGYPNSKIFQALYNGGNVFAAFGGNLNIPFFGSATTGNENLGPTAIGALTSMQSTFKLTLSQGDRANATSNFEVVPEPGSLLALASGMGFLGLLRRRRA